jgi:radical SAM superfamily enzyme YgiQ (UPF0313 family)
LSRITLVEPLSAFNGYSHFKLPLLGLLYLGTILKRLGHQVTVHSEDISPVLHKKSGFLDPALQESDVVGISAMTCTANRAYAIARAVRSAKPKVRIFIGGPHATFMPQEASLYADVVVLGEAESNIGQLVENTATRGIFQGQKIPDLDQLPYPDFSLMGKLATAMRYAPLSTSRGCPFDCSFCSVTTMFGRKIRFRSPESVLDEIELRHGSGYRRFFFYDDNFGVSRERSKEFLEGILRKKLNLKWTAEARVEVSEDEELLKLMARTGCHYLLFGLESVNPKTLSSYNKKQSLEDIINCIRRVRRHDIKVHGMFVLGSDDDSSETVRQTVKFCNQFKVDSAQFAILFPIPGTRLYQKLETEGRIFTKDWSLYDGTHVVFRPKKMKAAELQQQFLWAWKKFYSLARLKGFLASRYLLKKWERINSRFLDALQHGLDR